VATAWRIVKRRHARTAFDGEGARLYGGRWTSPGRSAVYTSATIALATLEMLVHLDSVELLTAYTLFEVSFSDELVQRLDPKRLPASWKTFPAPAALHALGDAWLDAGRTPILRVPSAIVAVEFNYVLNPDHKQFRRITIGAAQPYRIDRRLG
jgi:RES domain-containing protein